jgi:SWIM zinc finger
MTAGWANKTEIRSETSPRVYVISEKVTAGVPTGTYGCSCPGWKGYGGQCKHLKSMGLPSCRAAITPRPRTRKSVGAAAGGRRSGFTSGYATYDTSQGFGSWDEWARAAENLATGRDRYRYRTPRTPPAGDRSQRDAPPKAPPRTSQAEAMRRLGLTSMPHDATGLVKAMRVKARVLHPDYGGDPAALTAMFDAYRQLLDHYPKM